MRDVAPLPDIDEIQCALARACMEAFVLYTKPDYLLGWVHECICKELDQFLDDVVHKRSPRLIVCCPPRSGKLCADETPVLTPDGWKTHGELKVGDYVYSPSGEPVRVIAVGPKDYATHGVEISTGETIAVHLDHEWTIYRRCCRRYETVETRFFLEPSKKTGKVRHMVQGPAGKRGTHYMHQLDRPNAIKRPPRDHILHPYCLGMWLGDGTTVAPRINMSPEDAKVVKTAFEELGVPITCEWAHPTTGVVTFSFASGIPNVRNKFSIDMKRLNLFNGKYIPDEYKFDSENNIRSLLAGLIDSDGYMYGNKYGISTSSQRLASDIAEVVRYIGEIPHIHIEQPRTSSSGIKGKKPIYIVSFFSTGKIPCKLKRKQQVGEAVRRKLAITNVKELDHPLRGNCIQVDSPDGLYLVGRTLVPTHNSELVSRRFPAYVFGRYPDMSIIATSYSSDLASRMNRDVQRIMDEDAYGRVFPDTKLYGKNIRTTAKGSYLRNSDIFEVVGHKGVYRSAGVGAGITGMGAECCIIDDPIRDRMSADSPTIRQNVWDWYTSTLYTRLAPGGGVIVMLTRWHCDDLVGRLIEAQRAGEGDQWRIVNFPAIAETDEYCDGQLVRRAGEALHPDRYPLEQLLAIKQAIGPRDWEALYQQRPTPDGGAIFRADWLRFWTPAQLPDFNAMATSWDMTFKSGADNDFVVGQVWGRSGANFYLLDQVRGRWSFTETVAQFQRLAQKWPQVHRHLVEDKANGPAVIDTLKDTVSGIVPVEPDGSKTARAHAVTTLFEAGNVLIPHPSVATWVRDYVAELTTFPSGAHDDQVDATTMGLRDLHTHRPAYIDPAALLQARMRHMRRW